MYLHVLYMHEYSVKLYVYMYVYTYVCINACMNVCMYVSIYVCMNVGMCVCLEVKHTNVYCRDVHLPCHNPQPNKQP